MANIKNPISEATLKTEISDDASGQAERLVILPSYVEPEYRQLIDRAEAALEDYSDHLLKQVKAELFKHGWNVDPCPSDIRKAEGLFREDPMRTHLLKNLVNIKALCERPRLAVKAT